MRKWHRQWECVVLFLVSSALSENEVSELQRPSHVQGLLQDYLDNANISTIGPQYFNTLSTQTFRTTDEPTTDINTVTTLEGPTEELEKESTITNAVNENGISSLNSSHELLHLIQQSTLFLNMAQHILSQTSNKTTMKIITHTPNESLLHTPSLTTEYTDRIMSDTSTLRPGSSIAATSTSFSSAMNVTTGSDDIETTKYIIIPTKRDNTFEENMNTKATPSFSTLVLKLHYS